MKVNITLATETRMNLPWIALKLVTHLRQEIQQECVWEEFVVEVCGADMAGRYRSWPKSLLTNVP